MEELARELRSSVGIATNVLGELGGAGLVTEKDGLYRYEPSNTELRGVVEEVAEAYAKFPVATVQAILGTPKESAQLFADAFRIKKD